MTGVLLYSWLQKRQVSCWDFQDTPNLIHSARLRISASVNEINKKLMLVILMKMYMKVPIIISNSFHGYDPEMEIITLIMKSFSLCWMYPIKTRTSLISTFHMPLIIFPTPSMLTLFHCKNTTRIVLPFLHIQQQGAFFRHFNFTSIRRSP